MDGISGAIGLPVLGAALHPLLGALVQRSSKLGVRLPVILGTANIMTFGIFLCYLRPDFSGGFGYGDGLAMLNGVLFFWGQWFSIQSVRKGDLVVHSAALGFKVVFVAVFSASVGLEPAGSGLFAGALLACLAVYFAAGATLARFMENRTTLWLTLVACAFFGTNDFLTGWKAQDIGGPRWLILMIGTAATLSVGMLLPRWSQMKEAFACRKRSLSVVGAGLTLGLQALLVNLAFSWYREPALSNIAYSTRGVMAVLFVWAFVKRFREPLGRRQLVGASLMIAALALVLL
ncbi:hypothetical protein [Haloferula sp.]|uniref:hypothetical protein n=1 Tax=Haloferula sp. TaxID=2497595 RepID=UPI003C71C105